MTFELDPRYSSGQDLY